MRRGALLNLTLTSNKQCLLAVVRLKVALAAVTMR